MAQTLLKKCDLCVQKDGIYFCYQCRHALCDACRNTHNKFPALSGHIIGKIDQVNLLVFSSKYRCDSHEKEFEIYCENCSCLICSQCVTTIHKDHEFSDISQTVSKEREEAKKTVADLKTKIKNTTDLKENIKCEHLVKLKSDAQHVIREIRETFQELTKVIESKKGIKETEIEDFEHFERQQFESILYCADSVIKNYTSTCSELENLLPEKHDITFHECYKAFTRDIDYTDSIINEPEKSKFPNFDVRSVFKEIFDHMNSKCKESLCESCIELNQRVQLLMKENTEYEERTKRDILQLEKLSTKLKDAESAFIAEKTFLQRELQSKIEEIEKSQENITDLEEQLKRMKEKCEKFELENHNLKVIERGIDTLLKAKSAEKEPMNSKTRFDDLLCDDPILQQNKGGKLNTAMYTSDEKIGKGVGGHETPFESYAGDTASNVGTGNDKLGKTFKGDNLENCVICMDTPYIPRELTCGHVFCQDCISQAFKLVNPVCPTCGSIQGTMTGNQPPGTMKIYRKPNSLAGYPNCGRIEISYNIHKGNQGLEHHTPGRYFEGISRTGYLPDNRKGKLVAKMLRIAFDRKLVFTIGDSRTTGKTGVVKWNDIHHKTNPVPHEQFGYPDPTYLDRVIDELAAKGVTEKDIPPDMPLA